MKAGLVLAAIGGFLIFAGLSNDLPSKDDLTSIDGEVADVRTVMQEVKGIDYIARYEIDIRRDDGNIVKVDLPSVRVRASDTQGLVGKRLSGKIGKLNNFWVLKVGERQLMTYERSLKLATSDDRSLTKMGSGLAPFGIALMAFGYWWTRRRGLPRSVS